uniref:Uncharacterized LOC100176079 n=1 Tax=Ciona intestinalis TaxID=7719 RepID=F6TFA5_CIOIN|nr:uncharacterized protein LOC100176079 isoform X2 [Ciona intestinalis]|eukprot:XP_002127005.1 uncharacterized protein LOC100176079 isoform X2 [Ciona intestinalis]
MYHETSAYQKHETPDYKYLRIFLGVGVVKLVVGCVSVLLGVWAEYIRINSAHSDYFEVYSPLWCAPFFIVAGGKGVNLSCKPSDKKMFTTMILAIVSGILGLVMYGFELVDSIQMDDVYFVLEDDHVALKILHGILTALGFLNFLFAKVLVAFCAVEYCKQRKKQRTYIESSRTPLLGYGDSCSRRSFGVEAYPYTNYTSTRGQAGSYAGSIPFKSDA